MKTIKLASLLFAGTTIFAACDKDNENENPTDPSTKTMTLNIDNLEDVGDDYTYEGWIIVDGAPVSTGTFDVDADGNLSKSSFSVDIAQLDAATDFVLSIEPVPDNDPAPSAIKLLGGGFDGNSADVSTAHGAALGDDLSGALGNYILATPTTTTTDDEYSGVWFLDLGTGAPATGLTLPALPEGWVYEGWAVIDGMPVTSGTFTMADGMDDDDQFSSQENDGPPFPGEDYIMNAPAGLSFPTDLRGGVAVISIEPYPDNDPAPFQLKPLVGMIDAGAMDHVTYGMDNNSANFPSGTVSR